MALSSFQAFCISAFISVSYVAGLYISKSARITYQKNGKSIQRDRDDDEVIRARLKAVYFSTCLSCGVVYWCIANDSANERTSSIWLTLKTLGFISSKNALKAHFLIPILYTGPFVAQYLSQTLPFQANWTFKDNLLPVFTTWIGFRNYIAAPFSEEVVFRACLLAIARMAQNGWYKMLFTTPWWFGLAHVHHAYEVYNRLGRTRLALRRAVITCLIQFAYTTLFGAYVSFLFLRTESVFPPFTAHITANLMGLPALSSELRDHPKYKLQIIVGYVIGIIGFISLSGPWTL